MRRSGEYIKRYNEMADELDVDTGGACPSSPRTWSELAHDLRTLATLASEISSLESQEDAVQLLNFEVQG